MSLHESLRGILFGTTVGTSPLGPWLSTMVCKKAECTAVVSKLNMDCSLASSASPIQPENARSLRCEDGTG